MAKIQKKDEELKDVKKTAESKGTGPTKFGIPSISKFGVKEPQEKFKQ